MFEPKRLCHVCGEWKYENDFHLRSSRCGDCYTAYHRAWKKSDHGKAIIRKCNSKRYAERRHLDLVCSAKNRARKAGVAFDLDNYKNEIGERVYSGFCELTGMPFDMDSKKSLSGGWASPSIDRITPSKGYVYTNIRIVLKAVNAGLGDWGEGVYRKIAEAYLERN